MIDFVKRKWKLVVFVSLGIIAAGFLGWNFLGSKNNAAAEAVTAAVKKGNIKVTVSGTGTAQPIITRSISSKVSGTITKINFKNGQAVKKGDLLFELDNSTVQTELVKADLDLRQAELDYGSTADQQGQQQVQAPISGQVSLLEVSKGQDVQKNASMMIIQDTGRLIFSASFNEAQVSNIQIGQKVDVTLPELMTSLTGRVQKVDRGGVANIDGSKSYYVTVEVNNPGSLTEGIKAQAAVHGTKGIEEGYEASSLEWADTIAVRAGIAGTVQQIYVDTNTRVKKGQKLAVISSDTINTQMDSQNIKLQQAQLNMEGLQKKEADYRIVAPVDGYVNLSSISTSQGGSGSSGSSSSGSGAGQNYWQVGDEASPGETLATVIGSAGMAVTVPIDEVDISKVKLGQSAVVTVDALPDRTYRGTVTEVAAQGTVQNGVANFDVTVQIDKPDEIKSKMTANVEVMVAQKDNVLLLPIEAVQERQGKKFVIPAAGAGKAQPAGTGQRGQADQGDQAGQRGQGGQSGQGGDQASQGGRSGQGSNQSGSRIRMKPVETGLYNETFIEIKSGLAEGEKVTLPAVANSSSSGSGGNGARGGIMGGGNRSGDGGGRPGGGGGDVHF